MTNNKQSSIEWLIEQLKEYDFSNEDDTYVIKIQSWVLKEKQEQAQAMQKQQSEHYATFITNCVINNLPTITFNDWINLHNNEQQ